jgi:hypothetical protein
VPVAGAGTIASGPVAATDATVRDESPAAVTWGGTIWLFWHSNVGGRWQIWARPNQGAGWGAAQVVPIGASNDKEPAVAVDATGVLRLFFRSQRGGDRFRSRTVDTATPAGLLALQERGRRDDRLHYTYDTGRGASDWYARDAVGLFLTPTNDGGTDAQHAAEVTPAQSFVAPFRPVSARLVWLVKTAAGSDQAVASDG